ISGSAALTKLGSGSLTLSSANTYDGGTNINVGTVSIGNVAALGTGLATVGKNASTNVSNSFSTIAYNLDLGGTSSGSGALVNSGTNTFICNVAFSANTSVGGSPTRRSSDLISGSAALTKLGSGSLTLSSANTYDGGTNINVGTVSIGNAAALGTGLATV